MKNGDKPAYPDESHAGLTKREHFASMAMQGLLSGSGHIPGVTRSMDMRPGVAPELVIAEFALSYADALLKALDDPAAVEEKQEGIDEVLVWMGVAIDEHGGPNFRRIVRPDKLCEMRDILKGVK